MNSLNILIVENESLVAMELSQTIKLLGYNVVEYATNSTMAKEFLMKYDVNLLIMDINLEENNDGIELYKSFQTDIPVIYITAYVDDSTISKAVSTNPLAYLVKPHNEHELNALLKIAYLKIKNLYVKENSEAQMFTIGDGYFFHQKQNKLLFNEIWIKLTSNELKLLKLLIASKGNIVSYTLIESEIWSNEFVNSTALRMLIYRLRGKLEHKFIETAFNEGIIFKI